MSAPIIEVLGAQLALLLSVTLAVAALASIKRYKPKSQTPIEAPSHYIRAIDEYLTDAKGPPPIDEVLFVTKALRREGMLRRSSYTAVRLLLILATLTRFIKPIGRASIRSALRHLTG